MHPRSPYVAYVDFRKLGQECPGFAPYVNANSNVDFRNPAAVRELAKSLLARDFGLTVELPEDRLCPMIPNRLDYILWIQDLIDSTSCDLTSESNPSSPVTGLDVGTGASCIYPLLGCTLRPSWRFIATDVDHDSLQSASCNITANAVLLGDRIQLHETGVEWPLFSLDTLGIENIDFTMCNPPFYTSTTALAESAAKKALPPSSACTGTPTEMVYTPTGEVGFAKRMLQESIVLGTRIRWYTTLFGKLSSVSTFVSELRTIPQLGESGNWAVTEMVQGTTRRWAVAWSFGDRKPLPGGRPAALKGCFPSVPSELEFGVDRSYEEVCGEVMVLLAGLELLQIKRDGGEFYGEAKGNVWSRAARRAMAKGSMDATGDEVNVRLGFLVTVKAEGRKASVRVRWKRGRDGVLFESFCGMVKRKLQLER